MFHWFNRINPIFLVPKRIGGLDGLRALCVILVLIDHARIGHLWESGALAVWVFFVLSGYLIAPILFNARLRVEDGSSTPGAALMDFVWNRALRIFPIYYLSLIGIALLLGYAASPENAEKFTGAFYWLLTYTTNIYIGFVRGDWLGPVSHLWTLAIEQQFYVLFPLVFVFLPSRYWLAALLGGSLAMLAVSAAFWFDDTLQFRVSSLSGFFAIGLGAAMGLHRRNNPVRNEAPTVDLVSFGLIALLLVQHYAFSIHENSSYSLIITPFLAVVLIDRICCNQNSVLVRVLEWPLLRGVGVVSYGFYLYHGPILGPSGQIVSLLTGLQGDLVYKLVQSALAFVITLSVSIASFLIVEEPLMKLKKGRQPPLRVSPQAP